LFFSTSDINIISDIIDNNNSNFSGGFGRGETKESSDDSR
jgi:hypothetical protein